jgi:hypothetical protein
LKIASPDSSSIKETVPNSEFFLLRILDPQYRREESVLKFLKPNKTLYQAIAEENGMQLYRVYTECEAAEFLGFHPQSLKTIRLQGKITHLRISARKISYLGQHLVE